MTKIVSWKDTPAHDAIIDEAASVIKRGSVILYPTDTIYGLGCDALRSDSVKRVYEIKRRPETKPALIIVNSYEMLSQVVEEIPPIAVKLMKDFWPGPLTLIFRANTKIPPLLTAGTATIGIRIPDHQFCLRLLDATRIPIVSTSANRSNVEYSTENARHLADEVDLMIEDEIEEDNVKPSTIVDVTHSPAMIVREGAIDRRTLDSYLLD